MCKDTHIPEKHPSIEICALDKVLLKDKFPVCEHVENILTG